MEDLTHKTWDVRIEYDGKDCEVVPIEFEAKHGDQVRFHNLTDKDVCVLFSKDELFKTDKLEIKGNEDKSLTVEVELPEVGKVGYTYAVFCRKTDDFARAGSMPIIIIIRK